MHSVGVFYDRFSVGTIAVDEKGARFSYHPRWLQSAPRAFPISLTMPLPVDEEGRSQEGVEYGTDILMPWLANLLPEATALKTVGRKLGIAPEDAIGILQRIGQDTAGALSIGTPREGGNPGHHRIRDPAELERIINGLPAKPFLVGEDGVSMSLAGVQEKLPVAKLDDGSLAIPVNGAPSTHILKPDDDTRLYGSVQNEALCLILARHCGLKAAGVTTGRAGKRSYLLVTRYDRVRTGPEMWARIHQEDFCQALGKPPAAKYERNQSGIKGPRLVDMFGLVKDRMSASDTVRLLDAVIFNVLICNTDSHAKNYGILLTGKAATLAPLYDLMCADCWDVTRNMAQTIADKDRGGHILGRHWQRMAAACGLNPTSTLQRVEKLALTVLAEANAAAAEVVRMPAGPHRLLPDFVKAIEKRCRTVLSNLAEVEAKAGRAAIANQ